MEITDYLPEDSVARNNLEEFHRRFPKPDHLFLAAHAAFPVALTPDLLHKIWLNFRKRSENSDPIPYEVVSDVLLSPLVEKTGRFTYKMKSEIRSSLLKMLLDHCGPAYAQRLAAFLKFYLKDNDPRIPFETLREALRWNAMVYLEPHRAAARLLELFQDDQTSRRRLRQLLDIAGTRTKLLPAAPAVADPLTVAYRLVEGQVQQKQGYTDKAMKHLSAIKHFLHRQRQHENDHLVYLNDAVLEALQLPEDDRPKSTKAYGKIHLLADAGLDQSNLALRLFGIALGDPKQPMWSYNWEGKTLDDNNAQIPCSFQVWHWTSAVPAELDRILMTSQGICIAAANRPEILQQLTGRFRSALAHHVIFQVSTVPPRYATSFPNEGEEIGSDPHLGGVYFLPQITLKEEHSQFQNILLKNQQTLPLPGEIIEPVLLNEKNPLGQFSEQLAGSDMFFPAPAEEHMPLLSALNRAGFFRRLPDPLTIVLRDAPQLIRTALTLLEKARKAPLTSREAPKAVWDVLIRLGLCNRAGDFRAWLQTAGTPSAFRPYRHTRLTYAFEYLPPELWLETLAFLRELGLDCSEESYPATVYWNRHLIEIHHSPDQKALIINVRPIGEQSADFLLNEKEAYDYRISVRVNELLAETEYYLLKKTELWLEEPERKIKYQSDWENLNKKWSRDMATEEDHKRLRLEILSSLTEMKTQMLSGKPDILRLSPFDRLQSLLEGQTQLTSLPAPFHAFPYTLKYEKKTETLPPYAPEMVRIPAGTFQMGDVMGDNEYDDEKPVHEVTLPAFELARHPVTFEAYDAFCEASGREKPKDEGWGRERRPVIYVSWFDAVAYCNWLSEQAELEPVYDIDGEKVTAGWQAGGYRLPTEAEWEYAAREGGKKVRFGNGKDIADPKEINFDASENYKKPYSVVGEYRAKTTPVGSFPPNALGLYDMSGNVYDWCWDWSGDYPSDPQSNPKGPDTGSRRVRRGGSWNAYPVYVRCAVRLSLAPGFRRYVIGFRLARTVAF